MKKNIFSKKKNVLTAWISTPPYYGVPWVVWLYAALCCAMYPHGGVFSGLLSGYDDHVRMTQVLNWVNGAGFYDRTITRVDPPQGFTTIWSRIVDMPIAAVILLAQLYIEQKTAALVASIIVPFMELAVLFWAARYYARPIAGSKEARLIVLFLMFTSILNYKSFSIAGFHPGEASHHPWYIILNLLLFGATARMALGTPGFAPIRMMAIALALLLSVGIEGFPVIAGIIGVLAMLGWHWDRPNVIRKSAIALALGACGAALLLPLHQPPEKLLTISFAEPSLLGPVLLSLAAFYLAFEWYILRIMGRYKMITLPILFFAALLLALLLVRIFPAILAGPAAALTASERMMAYREHAEAQPLFRVAGSALDFLGLLMPTFLALTACLFAITRSKTSRKKAMFFCYFGIIALTGGLAEDIARFYHHAMTSACGGLLLAWQQIRSSLKKNQAYSLISLLIFIILGPFWMLVLPALLRDSPIFSQVLLFPAKLETMTDACNVVNFGRYLNSHYNPDTILMVPGSDSSRLLYYSDLVIDFLNNYPSQDRFIDNQIFFGTQDTEVAKAIAYHHHIDLVALCHIAVYKLNPLAPGEEPMMFERLEAHAPPAWLKEINTGIGGDYKLFEVDKSALSK